MTSAVTFNLFTSPDRYRGRDPKQARLPLNFRSDVRKSATVDLVVAGDERAAVAAAVDALRRGQRVLVVLRSGGPRMLPRLRRLGRAARNQLTVMTNAEVVCVDGVHGVEAVVVRYMRTGRLCAVNTSAFLSCNGSIAAEPPVRKSSSAAQTP